MYLENHCTLMRYYLLLFFTFYGMGANAQCDHPDYEGLMALYHATDGDNWSVNGGWKEGSIGASCDPCNWDIVVCENNRVVHLFLTNYNLDGTIPDLDLEMLRSLKLGNNSLSGQVPDFSKLPSLLKLNLSNNNLIGQIPDFGHLPNLEELDLSNNRLLGVVPDFSQLKKLEELDLNDNIFSGLIPDFQNLPELRELDLSLNYLTGAIPDFSKIPKLERLNLFSMLLLDVIPDFSNLPVLEFIDLGFNSLTGTVPAFSKTPKLKSLTVWGNNLESPIPDFKNLNDLEFLELGSNNLSGEIPDFSILPSLKELNLGECNLSGPIPKFSNLPALKNLWLRDNQLTGSIPNLIENCPNIKELDINNNRLSGCYPEFVCDLSRASFSGNTNLPWEGDYERFCNGEDQVGAFCGGEEILSAATIQEDCACLIIPCVSSHPAFEKLMQFYNDTGGPNWKDNRGWRLAALGATCAPCHDVPLQAKWYGIECDDDGNIISIDFDGLETGTVSSFGGNNLSGPLPQFDLPHLKQLILSGNKLTGEFPDLYGMPQLETIAISNNDFSGPLPTFENNLELKVIRASYNHFTGTIPDISHLPELSTLTISNNQLAGCFPQGICDLTLFHAVENFAMPWQGHHENYCADENQEGAPCITSNGALGAINQDCNCVITSNTQNLNHPSITVSPNPVNDVLKINGLEETSSYVIYSLNGDVLQKGHVTLNTIQVGLLSSGLYILEILSPNVASNFIRFIK